MIKKKLQGNVYFIIRFFLYGILLITGFLFPVVYVQMKPVKKKLLFLSACYGADQIITLLITIALLPMLFLGIYMFPQIEASGHNYYLEPVLLVTNVLIEDGVYFTSVLLFILPSVFYKKYKDLFVKTDR